MGIPEEIHKQPDAKESRPTTVQPLRGISPLLQQAVVLLADGVSDEKVASELAVPVD